MYDGNKLSKIKKNYLFIALGAFCLGFAINLRSDHTVACAVYFSPGQHCVRHIIGKIKNAKREILIQSYSFTSLDIADALIDAHNRGVKVYAILDHSQEKKMMVLKLFNAKIPVFIDKPLGIAHNKVMIIDDEIVLTGSYNFTNAAEHRNVENSIHLTSKEIAREYKRQWLSRFKLSKKYTEKL